MASTNKTTNYELSQFVGSDIPAWLSDYNGDMSKIDAGIHAAKVQADGAASGVSALQTAVSGKQDTLNFDNAPIAGSANPVTSGGIYNALQNVSVQTDAVPTAGSTKAVQSGGVYAALQAKQNTLTFDSMPTQNSANPVTSGGVFAALSSISTSRFNSKGSFKNVSGTSYPQLRYIYSESNRLFLGFDYTDYKFTVASNRWVAPSDATFPATNKLYYIDGNPFNLPTNTTFPSSQTDILSATTIHVGLGVVDGVNIFLHLLYVSDENKTYLIATSNNPPATNVSFTTILIGDLGYN